MQVVLEWLVVISRGLAGMPHSLEASVRRSLQTRNAGNRRVLEAYFGSGEKFGVHRG